MSYINNSDIFFLNKKMTENFIFQTIKAITEQHYLHARELIAKTTEQFAICLTN